VFTIDLDSASCCFDTMGYRGRLEGDFCIFVKFEDMVLVHGSSF